MGNLKGYDANKWEPNDNFEALPEGDYPVVIIESDFQDTKAGDGSFLLLKLQVIDGPFKNRTLFDRLNLDNPNEQAVEIAKRTLSSICRAVGRMTPEDSRDLHNLPLMARVGQRPYQNRMTNEIRGYKALKPSEGAGQPAGRAPAPQPEPAAAGRSGNGGARKAPWDR